MEIDEAAEKIAGILTQKEVPKVRRSFDSYAHPHTVQRAQRGIAIEPVQPTTKTKICSECGTGFEPYKNGATSPNKCRDCLSKNIAAGMTARKKMKEPQEVRDEVVEKTIALVFKERDQAIYNALLALADEERRTPDQQLLFMLDMALRQEVDHASDH